MARIIGSTTRSRSSQFGQLVDAWRTSQADHRHVYGETRRFIEVAFRNNVSQILWAFGGCSATEAQKVSEACAAAQYRPPQAITELVRIFARSSDTHEAAGKLAVVAAGAIKAEEDVAERTRLLAGLCRAMVPASRDEARALFSQGLNELDALGSGDYDFASELLHFAASIRNGPLEGELTLRLAKICEISVYDTDKWQWPLTAAAFASVGGISYLAQLCRWHDRGKVSLEYTLGSTLTELIKKGAISSVDALGLQRLTKPLRMWDWDWHHFLGAVLDDPSHSDNDLSELLSQMSANEPGVPRSVGELETVLAGHPEALAAVRDTLDTWRTRRNAPRRVRESRQREEPTLAHPPRPRRNLALDLAKHLENIDPTDPSSLERLIERLDAIQQIPNTTRELVSGLRARVPYAKRGAYIEALLSAGNLEFFNKLALFEEAKKEWQGQSPTAFPHLMGAGRRIVDAHAEELLARPWGGPTSDLHKIARLTGDPVDMLAIRLGQAALDQDLEPSAGAWLSLATLISASTPDGPAKAAMTRLLKSGAARLVDEVGDGPWTAYLDPGSSEEGIVAGMLWFGLGSPTAELRWRAAHAVRYFASRGRWSIVDLLFAKLKKSDGGAFSDPDLPFFKLHATLWFLMSVARIAKDFPAELAKHADQLRSLALAQNFLHVGIRQAAREAVQAIGGDDVIGQKLALVNHSPFKHGARSRPSDGPTVARRADGDFYFDYDFNKYRITALGRMFGLPSEEVQPIMRKWIGKWAPAVDGHHELSGRRPPYQRSGYRSTDGYHSYGDYLSWHALAAAAGELLASRPLLEPSYPDEDDWLEFVRHYQVSRGDGLWLSDGTGQAPIVALHELRSETDGKLNDAPPLNDPAFLLQMAGFGPKIASQPSIVHAHWSSPDSVTVHIASALVPRESAAFAAKAVAGAPEFHQWVPISEHDDESWHRTEFAPLRSWIASIERQEELDAEDPLGARSAICLHKPSRWMVDEFGLAAQGPFAHRWVERDGLPVFQYDAWGERYGDGERIVRENGHMLSCEPRFLQKVLRSTGSKLVLLVRLQRFHEKQRYGPEGEVDSKFTRSSVTAIVDEDLNVTPITLSARERAAIEKLSQYDQPDFSARFRIFARAKPRSRVSQRPAQNG